MTASTFLLNAAVTPWRVVVGRHQPGGVLDEVGAEQERAAVARLAEQLAHVGEERGPLRRVEVADRRAEERHHRARTPRQVARGAARSRPPRARPPRPAARPRSRGRPRRAPPGRRRTARTGAACPRRAARRSSSRVFSEVPLPSSSSVSAAARRRDLGGVRLEDRPLGAGRVVLGQPGDLVEQLAAAGVVEVLRRQHLRGGGEAGADVVGQLAGEGVGVEVDGRARWAQRSGRRGGSRRRRRGCLDEVAVGDVDPARVVVPGLAGHRRRRRARPGSWRGRPRRWRGRGGRR